MSYAPELGQIAFGAPWGEFEMPEYAQALFEAIRQEIERVSWNRNQSKWEGYDDPGIDGITWNAYWWGKEDAPEAAMPNFVAEDVEVRWYKYPGRGMSVNVEMMPGQWVNWFDRVLAIVRAADDLP